MVVNLLFSSVCRIFSMASLYTVSVENVKSVAQKNGTQAARYADIRKYMESAEKQSNAVDKKLRLCKNNACNSNAIRI